MLKIIRALLLVSLLIVAVACSGGGNPPAADKPTTAPSGEQPTEAPSGEQPTEAPSGEQPTAAPSGEQPTAASSGGNTSVVSRENLDGSLANLDSYRLHFTFGIEGKDKDGKPQKGAIEILQEYIKASHDRRMTYSTTGNLGQTGSLTPTTSPVGGKFEIIQIGDTSYLYSPEGQNAQKCLGYSSSDQGNTRSMELFKPSDIIGGLKNAKLAAKGETVNGVKADHYTFDQTGLDFGSFSSAKGDAWVASDGGYVVKYVGQATGQNALFGQSTEGTFTWEYTLEEVNQLKEIALPKECENQKPSADIPVPENATEKNSFGNIQTYKTSDEPAKAAEFYKQQLPTQGWQAGSENKRGDAITLDFTKEGRKITVTVTKDEKGSSVIVMENKAS
jgi:hypothetical protein